MFYLVPVGVDDHEVDRFPVVSIAIAAACALVFVATWVVPLGTSKSEWFYHFSFVPARGLWQVGWFSSMFVHFGWMHLLGNLLFFYICAPLLEDCWGRPLFLIFYLGWGLLAGAAQYALEPQCSGMIAGASGAIAGCMGAFSVRHARRRVRMGYLFLLFRGTFAVPAWVWGLVWFAHQGFDFATGGAGNGGVAVGAHLGGFAAGGAFAVVLASSGLERRFIAPAVERQVGWSQHPAYFEGLDALARTDPHGARAAFKRVLAERPEQLDARAGLARADIELRKPEARVEVESVLGRAATGGVDVLAFVIEQLGSAAAPEALRPAIAWMVAQTLDAASYGKVARGYYVVAARLDSLPGRKAMVRSLELEKAPAPAALLAAADKVYREPELKRRVEFLLRSVLPTEGSPFQEHAEEDGEHHRSIRGEVGRRTETANYLLAPSPKPRS